MTKRQRTIAKVGAFIWIPGMVLAIASLASVDPEESASTASTVFALIFFLAFCVTFAGIIFMIRHIYTESDLTEGWKTGWTAILLFFNVFAAPFYWVKHRGNEDGSSGSDLAPPT